MSIADVRYLEPETFYRWMREGTESQTHAPFQVVDVRDSDHIGGHILGSWNYPYREMVKSPSPVAELVERLAAEHEQAPMVHVIFHCAQSQQRGPAVALKFLRETRSKQTDSHYTVWVLRGGFNRWQDLYGEDETVTEGYEPALWAW